MDLIDAYRILQAQPFPFLQSERLVPFAESVISRDQPLLHAIRMT